ncbi:MAG: hypothetical protein U9N19_07120 [Thermodesulfobacteriota bacterium]|nr:hypothetical protein [Thermodesulfobacteriota bacterium]
MNKSASALNSTNLTVSQAYEDIVSKVQPGANYLIITPSTFQRASVATELILAAGSGRKVWYVVPKALLTAFKVFLLKSGLNDLEVSLMSLSQRQVHESQAASSQVVIWSLEILRDHLSESDCWHAPDLIIFDEANYLGHPETGTAFEEVLLCLPKQIPVVLLMSQVSNINELSAWLEVVRELPCCVLEINLPVLPLVPAFISSHWDIIPLTDRKRLTGKVKRILKEEPPFPKVRSLNFIKQLVSFLREEKLTPSIVVMPSAKDCDWAAKACIQVMKKAGEVLTAPQISKFLDTYPFLKDYSFLPIAVSKRLAPLHSDHHPLWCELVEYFLSFDNIDIVFTTIEGIAKIITKVESIVLCTSEYQPSWHRQTHKITQEEIEHLKSLVVSKRPNRAGCISVVHLPDVKVVLLKDLLIHKPGPLISTFRCDGQTVLSLLAQGIDITTLLAQSLLATQSLEKEDGMIEELLTELREELPEAGCFLYFQTITSLIDLRLQVSVRLEKLMNRTKGSPAKWKEKEREELVDLLSLLPCEDCVHFSFCHKRASRRIRYILDKYYETRKQRSKTITGVKLDLAYHLKYLQELGWFDQEQHLSPEGELAHKTGLKFPQGLTECLKDRSMPLSEQDLFFAMAGGFVEWADIVHPAKTKPLENYIEELREPYKNIKPGLSRVDKQMLLFGLLVPKPVLWQSALLLAYKRGKDVAVLAQDTGISIGAVLRLIYRTNYLVEQISYFGFI